MQTLLRPRRALPLLAIGGLHICGLALVIASSSRVPALPGLAMIAYAFGVRHAFDVDHIAAIDNATRKLCGSRRSSGTAGFFFSLGHSTVVLGMVVVLAGAMHSSDASVSALRTVGGTLGAAVSALFLWVIGLANLAALLKLRRQRMAAGHVPAAAFAPRGMLSGVLGWAFRRIDAPWHMYPVGMAFGLGFDTASEITLLAFAVSTGGHSILAVLALPLLFAAGMSLFDTLDGALLSRAYRWTLASPEMSIRYGIAVTAISVAVALSVGTFELAQLLGPTLAAHVTEATSQMMGVSITASLLLVWCGYAVGWRVRETDPDTARAAER